MSIESLISYLIERLQHVQSGNRFILGIVGFPGAGKTTLAQSLVDGVNAVEPDVAAMVPMDGFHLPNSKLDERQLRPLKGVPETFDAQGFVDLLAQLRETPARRVEGPAFDRSLDEPTPGAIVVEPRHRFVVAEGNYLLLPEEPWDAVAKQLDEAWYIDVAMETIVPRLIERHILGGRDEHAAREKMENTDLRNARLIATTRALAHRILVQQKDGSYCG